MRIHTLKQRLAEVSSGVVNEPPLVDEPVCLLRPWGRGNVYTFPDDAETKREILLVLRALDDPWSWNEADIIFRHTGVAESIRIRRVGSRWVFDDSGRVRIDGTLAVEITSGSEIEIGNLTLVAAGLRAMALTKFLGRLVGGREVHYGERDRALRAIRLAAQRRGPLGLAGEDDLAAIAYDLHRLAVGERMPFVICDPVRRTRDRLRPGSVAATSVAEALELGAGGSICVWASRLPMGFADLERRLTSPGATAQLVILGRNAEAVQRHGVKPIEVVALHERAGDEINRMIWAYANDARERLGMALRLEHRGREWIREHAARTLGDIQRGTERVMAVYQSGNVAHAAALLGISAQALTTWLQSRGIMRAVDLRGLCAPLTRVRSRVYGAHERERRSRRSLARNEAGTDD